MFVKLGPMQQERQQKSEPEPIWLDRHAHGKRTHFGRWPSRKERSREAMFRDWYGRENGVREIMAHQSGSVRAGEILGNVLPKLGLKRRFVLEDIREQWPEIVGKAVAAQTQPVSLRGKTLSVEVRSATWLHILEREHKHRVLANVQAACEEPINNIRFVPLGRYSPGRGAPGTAPRS